MICGGIPGDTALSIPLLRDVPSGLTNSRLNVVKNPPVAGPNPTHTMSASIFWRSMGAVSWLFMVSFIVSLLIG
jgi:hypothetical protein